MKTVVLLSGGIDSTVLLGLRSSTDECLALTFDYGQTHSREIEAAAAVAVHYEVEHQIAKLPWLDGAAISHSDAVVPGRNFAMLATASVIGLSWGASAVVFGANRDDIIGFQDCRPDFVEAMNDAAFRGGCPGIYAPFIGMTKAEVIAYGHEISAPLHLTWSCYQGGDEPCGQCGACELIA